MTLTQAQDASPSTPATPVDPALLHDVQCVLLQCHRDRSAGHALRPDAGRIELETFATQLAAYLAQRIGGRYVPKNSRATTAARDEAVWQTWQRTRDYRAVTRQFGISRRLLFTILARKRP
jgi:Mor family transcriptional regulator